MQISVSKLVSQLDGYTSGTSQHSVINIPSANLYNLPMTEDLRQFLWSIYFRGKEDGKAECKETVEKNLFTKL